MRERAGAGFGRGARWALAATILVELSLLGWWTTTGRALVAAVLQLLLLLAVALTVVLVRHLHHRRRFEAGIARSAAQRERVLVAEDLHDALGHELALIAIRAGALQVHSTGETAQQAADLRQQVDQAVLHLRETVIFLHGGDRARGSTPPAADVAGLVRRARDAGADVVLTGAVPPGAAAPARVAVLRVVQEGLTNAARHAPGAAVRVDVGARDGVVDGAADDQADDLADDQADKAVEVVVTTVGAAADPAGGWTGLAGLRRTVTLTGGSFAVETGGADHVVRATVPLVPARPVPDVPAERLRRPVASTLRSALLPTAAAVAAGAVFYTWASTGAVVEQADVDALRSGEPVAQAVQHLPARQAPVRLIGAAPPPAGSACAYYTDGNVPLAMATLEVCDDGVRLTRVTDLRELPPW